jgi:hypothetical protein
MQVSSTPLQHGTTGSSMCSKQHPHALAGCRRHNTTAVLRTMRVMRLLQLLRARCPWRWWGVFLRPAILVPTSPEQRYSIQYAATTHIITVCSYHTHHSRTPFSHTIRAYHTHHSHTPYVMPHTPYTLRTPHTILRTPIHHTSHTIHHTPRPG